MTANGRLAGVRASAPGPDDHGEAGGVGVASTGGLTGVDATGGTTGVVGRGGSVGVQGESAQGTAVHGVSQTGTGVAAEGAIGVASQASGTAVQATATGGVASTAVSAAAAQGTAVRAWSNAGRALDARSEVGDALYVTARRMGLAAWSEQASGVMGSCGGPNPLNIVRAGVMGRSDAYPGVLGQSDTGSGVEAVSQQGAAVRARADGGGTGVYATAGVNPATGTPGLPLLVEATRTGVTQLPHAAQFVGHVEISGDLIVVGGAKSAAVVTPDGGHRRVYCTEMPEAWIEDAGEVELVDGVAEVAIDERLAAIADVQGYQVFLSPYAPVRAYVAAATPDRSRSGSPARRSPRSPSPADGASLPAAATSPRNGSRRMTRSRRRRRRVSPRPSNRCTSTTPSSSRTPGSRRRRWQRRPPRRSTRPCRSRRRRRPCLRRRRTPPGRPSRARGRSAPASRRGRARAPARRRPSYRGRRTRS